MPSGGARAGPLRSGISCRAKREDDGENDMVRMLEYFGVWMCDVQGEAWKGKKEHESAELHWEITFPYIRSLTSATAGNGCVNDPSWGSR